MNPLDNLEQLAQRFVEGTFHRFFGKKLHPVDLHHQLAQQIEAERHGRADNSIPSDYHITLNPLDYMALIEQNDGRAVTAELADFLTTFAGEAGVQFNGLLHVELAQDESIAPGQVQISIHAPILDSDGGHL
jgi:hypothetical protein